MTDEQKQEHIRIVNQAIQILNKQVVNLMYAQARMTESISFLLTMNDDSIRNKRKQLDNEFYAAQQIIETDQIK